MIVLKILGVILTVLGFIGLYALMVIYSNKYTQEKFDYSFFSIANFVVICIALLCAYYGFEWYKSSLNDGGDTLNGLVLIGVGCFILLCHIIHNWVMTNFLYGFLGSIFQLTALLVPVAIFGITSLVVCFVVYFILRAFSRMGVQDVRIVK